MSDLFSSLVYSVPWAAFVVLALLTLALPVTHLLFAFGRSITGGEPRVDWWVLGRILPLGIALAIVVPLALTTTNWSSAEQVAVAEIAVIFLTIAAVIVPIALPLLQAYVQRLPKIGTFAYTILAFLALPVAGALATQGALFTTMEIEQSNAELVGSFPVVFLQDTTLSSCKQEIAYYLPDGFGSHPHEFSGDRGYSAFFLFWVDMTLKASFLDFFEVFDCGVSDLRPNPGHLLMSSFVFIYRAFVSLIVLAVVALPFARASVREY